MIKYDKAKIEAYLNKDRTLRESDLALKMQWRAIKKDPMISMRLAEFTKDVRCSAVLFAMLPLVLICVWRCYARSFRKVIEKYCYLLRMLYRLLVLESKIQIQPLEAKAI